MTPRPNNRIAMLFLGAGASRRMGRAKALLPWRGATLIGHHFATLRAVPLIEPWIVTRPNDAPLARELDAIGWPAKQRAVNPSAPDCEMLESIRVGVSAALTSDCASIGVALIDQALTRPATFKQLVAAAAERPNHVLQPAFEGRRGHPVLLPRAIAERLADHPGPTFKDFLADHAARRGVVEVDDRGVVTDMDTPEAYREQLSTP